MECSLLSMPVSRRSAAIPVSLAGLAVLSLSVQAAEIAFVLARMACSQSLSPSPGLLALGRKRVFSPNYGWAAGCVLSFSISA